MFLVRIKPPFDRNDSLNTYKWHIHWGMLIFRNSQEKDTKCSSFALKNRNEIWIDCQWNDWCYKSMSRMFLGLSKKFRVWVSDFRGFLILNYIDLCGIFCVKVVLIFLTFFNHDFLYHAISRVLPMNINSANEIWYSACKKSCVAYPVLNDIHSWCEYGFHTGSSDLEFRLKLLSWLITLVSGSLTYFCNTNRYTDNLFKSHYDFSVQNCYISYIFLVHFGQWAVSLVRTYWENHSCGMEALSSPKTYFDFS